MTKKDEILKRRATGKKASARTGDSFTNVMARLGWGQNNQFSGARYDFDFMTRKRTELEAAYRTSWLVGAACDYHAEDMTREGIDFDTTIPPDKLDRLKTDIQDLDIWHQICLALTWARLFGGSLAVMMIDGQDVSKPINPDSIRPGQFKGLLVLDRWMVSVSQSQLVTEFGPDLGKPKFYTTIADDRAIPPMKIHHSRCLRFDGIELPYWQRRSENYWGMSVIERLHDRLVAFDSVSQGAAQLAFKAHLRTVSIEGYREAVAYGGPAFDSLVKQLNMIRLFQTNEGLTVLDAKDKFETHSYTFSGLSDVLLQFGQQLSGALEMPLVRLFGQSPAGLNSTGESDLRTYYDGVKKKQERTLRRPLTKLMHVMSRSTWGIPLPDDFRYRFNPLWQTSDKEKAETGEIVTRTVLSAHDAGVTSQQTTLKELKQSNRQTGLWSNITDEEIEQAESDPPPPPTTDPEADPGIGSETGDLTADAELGSVAILRTEHGPQEVRLSRHLGGKRYRGKVTSGKYSGQMVEGDLAQEVGLIL